MVRTRRRHPVALALAVFIVAAAALSYGIGFGRDSVAVDDRSAGGIVRGTLATCAGKALTPLSRSLVQHARWSATPRRLCKGMATLTLRLGDGSIASCTGFNVAPGHDWLVTLTGSGCGRFEQATLPALP